MKLTCQSVLAASSAAVTDLTPHLKLGHQICERLTTDVLALRFDVLERLLDALFLRRAVPAGGNRGLGKIDPMPPPELIRLRGLVGVPVPALLGLGRTPRSCLTGGRLARVDDDWLIRSGPRPAGAPRVAEAEAVAEGEAVPAALRARR